MTAFYWDFDGTLVESRHLWSGSVYRALKLTDPATRVTFSQIRPHMACGFPWHTPQEDHTAMVGEAWWREMERHFCRAYLSLGVSPKIAGTAAKRVREVLLDLENYRVCEDAVPTLRRLQERGYKNILLSNNHPDLEKLMDGLGLSRYFDAFVVSGCVGFDKPRREIFEIAKRACPSADIHVMIGDNPVADIRGGKAAGMKTVLAHRGFCAEADWCVDELSGILLAGHMW